MSLLLLCLLLPFVVSFPVLAATISGAEYGGTILIASNNTSSASGVVALFTLNTDEFIDDDFANSNLNNTAVLTAGGADAAYCPVPGTSNWTVWVSSVAAASSLNYKLYTGGPAMNGTIRYIPYTTGMTTADNATIELGDNFTIEQKGYIDTSGGSNKTAILKEDAFKLWNNAEDTITVGIWTGTEASNTLRYSSDSEETTYEGSYTKLKEITLTEPVTTVRVKFDIKTNDNSYAAYGKVYKNGVAIGTEQQTLSTSYVTKSEDIAANADVGDKIQLYGHGSGGHNCYVQNFRIYYDDVFSKAVTATGISSGEHTIKVTADGTNLKIYVDDVEKDSVALSGSSVPDNANDWTFCQNGAIPYMEYHKIWVDGTLVQHIAYEYDTTFSDLSGYNNTATPTFYSTASDGNVTAALVSFLPLDPAELTGYNATEPSSYVINTTPTEPSEMYGELNTMHLPGADLVNNALTEGDIPLALFWIPVAMGLAAGIGFVVYGFTNSLLVQAIVSAFIMFGFALTGGGIIPWWTPIIFMVEALGILIARKQLSW